MRCHNAFKRRVVQQNGAITKSKRLRTRTSSWAYRRRLERCATAAARQARRLLSVLPRRQRLPETRCQSRTTNQWWSRRISAYISQSAALITDVLLFCPVRREHWTCYLFIYSLWYIIYGAHGSRNIKTFTHPTNTMKSADDMVHGIHVLYAAVSIIRPFIKFSRLSILWPLKHIIAPSCTKTLGRANLVQCTQYIGRDFSYLHLCIFSKCGILWGNIPSSLNSYPWIIIMEYSGSQLYDDRNFDLFISQC